MELTKEYLNWLFDYDQERGVLIWKNHWSGTIRTKYIGRNAGNINRKGYRAVTINFKEKLAHHLIWFLEHDVWPTQIDHINGDKTDNRIVNLRHVTTRQNCNNFKIHRRGKLVGASWEKRRLKWESYIHFGNKKKHLGYFNSELEAHQRYMDHRRECGAL